MLIEQYDINANIPPKILEKAQKMLEETPNHVQGMFVSRICFKRGKGTLSQHRSSMQQSSYGCVG